MQAAVQQSDVVGLWRRGLLRVPGRTDDRTTDVVWVQGPRHYVDLRQHAAARAAHVRRPVGLSTLTLDDVLALASQEGFAGPLRVVDGVCAWEHVVDLQPPAAVPDEARLTLYPRADAEPATDLLVEVGVHAGYVEHWWRDEDRPDDAVCAIGVDVLTGAPIVVVVAGGYVGLARGRTATLPSGADLHAAVLGAADLSTARALVDCELSLGRRSRSGWQIERSSLPWCESVTLHPQLDGDILELVSAAGAGGPARRWRLTGVVGRESLLAGLTDPVPLLPRPRVLAR